MYSATRTLLLAAMTGCCLVMVFPTTTLYAQRDAGCEVGEATAFLDANRVRTQLYNTGGLFWNVDNGPVYTVPKRGDINAIFASSFWVAGMIGNDLRMAATTYSSNQFVPGPLDEEGRPPADCAPYDRIYSVTRSDIETYNRTGEATSDIIDWPLGAPVEDGDGFADNYDLERGDRPGIIGDQTAWWVMNGVNAPPGSNYLPDIQMEVQVTAFAFKLLGPMNYVTFYRYDMIYRGDSTLQDGYAAFFVDADLGNAGDDFIGSDTTLDLAYTYNGDNVDDRGYGDAPPVVLKGPSAGDDGTDNDRDGEVDEAEEYLGMTSMISGQEFHTPQREVGYYRRMRGIWPHSLPLRKCEYGYSCDGEITKFIFSGDAAAREFWSEEDTSTEPGKQRSTPSDRRFVISSGPFTMSPGQKKSMVIAIVWARGEDRLDSVRQLKGAANGVHSVYESVIGPRFDSLVANKRQPSPPRPAPEAFRVDGPAPNPFSEQTTIQLHLSTTAQVSARVFNALGQQVREFGFRQLAAGQYPIVFNADDLAAGVYYYVITVDAVDGERWEESGRMVFVP